MDVPNISVANMDLIFSMRASYQFFTMSTSLSTKDTVSQLLQTMCRNAQRATNNTRLLMQGANGIRPHIEGLDTTGMMFTKAGVVVYITKCNPVLVMPRAIKYCSNLIPVRFCKIQLQPL